eukprot:1547591-Amphidinium_carterae.3
MEGLHIRKAYPDIDIRIHETGLMPTSWAINDEAKTRALHQYRKAMIGVLRQREVELSELGQLQPPALVAAPPIRRRLVGKQAAPAMPAAPPKKKAGNQNVAKEVTDFDDQGVWRFHGHEFTRVTNGDVDDVVCRKCQCRRNGSTDDR